MHQAPQNKLNQLKPRFRHLLRPPVWKWSGHFCQRKR